MSCRLFGDNPLSKPVMIYCQLDPKEHISMKLYLKFKSFPSRKYMWKCRLQKLQPCCLGLNVYSFVVYLLINWHSLIKSHYSALATRCRGAQISCPIVMKMFLERKGVDLETGFPQHNILCADEISFEFINRSQQTKIQHEIKTNSKRWNSSTNCPIYSKDD